MPPEQANTPAPIQPETMKPVPFWKLKKVWIPAVILMLVVVGLLPLRQPTPQVNGHLLAGSKSVSGDFQYHAESPSLTVVALYPAATPIKDPTIDARVRMEVEQFVLDKINSFKSKYANVPEGNHVTLELLYTQSLSSKTFSYVYETRISEKGGGSYLSQEDSDVFESIVFDNNGNRMSLGDLFTLGSGYLGIISREATGLVQQQLDQLARERGTTFTIKVAGLAPTEENFKAFSLNGTRLLIIFSVGQAADKEAGPLYVDLPLESLSALSGIVRPSILQF
ncbi:MAG: hypothetical protein RLZZ416_146 [Candidatus Parcubacteria bacterium]|jgi:hypothetical protein